MVIAHLQICLMQASSDLETRYNLGLYSQPFGQPVVDFMFCKILQGKIDKQVMVISFRSGKGCVEHLYFRINVCLRNAGKESSP